jgi:hypothetical protein
MNNYILVTDKSYMSIRQTEFDDLEERISDFLDIRFGDQNLNSDIDDLLSKLVSDKRALKIRLATKEIYECLSKTLGYSVEELVDEDKDKLEFVKDLHSSLYSLADELRS